MAAEAAVPDVEKKVVLTALIFCAACLALIGWAAVKLGVTVPGCVTDVKPFTEGSVTQTAPGRYEAHVVAKNWTFLPTKITVPKGSVVDFYITSKDVVHGFDIDGTNVNLMAIPGAVTYAQARFDTPGRHSVLCHEYCGNGHHDMLGRIEVTP